MTQPKTLIAQIKEWAETDAKQRSAATKKKKGVHGAEKIPADEFVALLLEHGGSAYKVAKVLGMSHTMVSKRRSNIENGAGVILPRGRSEIWKNQAHRRRIDLSMDSGMVLCGSDLHAWPEIYGTAMAAFIDLNRRLKPDFVVLNGDGMDGAQISRHSRLGWDKRPTPAEEIEALSEYSEALRKVNPNAKYIRTRGNHDSRLETYLASNAPAVEGLKGTLLSDHLPGWEECISININHPECIIKHRGRHSGIHGTFNELRALGTSFVHGHLHAQKLITYENAHGSIYGVDLGMLAPKNHPGFDYVEDDCVNWRSGFAVLTFRDGKIMTPDLATVTDEARGELYFRGRTLTYEL